MRGHYTSNSCWICMLWTICGDRTEQSCLPRWPSCKDTAISIPYPSKYPCCILALSAMSMNTTSPDEQMWFKKRPRYQDLDQMPVQAREETQYFSLNGRCVGLTLADQTLLLDFLCNFLRSWISLSLRNIYIFKKSTPSVKYEKFFQGQIATAGWLKIWYEICCDSHV